MTLISDETQASLHFEAVKSAVTEVQKDSDQVRLTDFNLQIFTNFTEFELRVCNNL
jgi:hypothetical protein